jgi:hypothetical protein
MFTRKQSLIFLTVLLTASAFRISVAHWLPNDAPDDGRVYAQIARNVLEQHVYSHDAQPPYDPSLIRLPGYPLFLAAIYSVFGHGNNGAARVVQAVVDTATCGLIALLAFYWQPDRNRKLASAMAALALAAICPFTTIYATTILTEVLTNFLMIAMFVTATLAFRSLTTEDTEEDKAKSLKRSLLWWIVAGLIGGLNVLFRPDSGLFVAAVGLTLVIAKFWSAVASAARHRFGSAPEPDVNTKRRRRFALPAHSKTSLSRTLVAGTVFSLAFLIVLTPWTIRNWRVFHFFQPLAPAHGEMPGEFVPRGYYLWLRTWIDDQSYVAPFLWSLDTDPIDIDDVPASAFDSADEKNRVAALLDKYNEPPDSQSEDANPSPPASPSPVPQASATAAPPNFKAPASKAAPSPTVQPQKNSNANSNASNASQEDENNNSGDESEPDDNNSAPDKSESAQQESVEMTPEIDAAFGQLARERIARHPFRFYIWLPMKRAHTMWFDTHSQYWPFEGTLLPFEDLDHEHRQQIWLPLFAGLTALYTLLGLAGAWFLWVSQRFDARRWLLLTVLAILLRLILFSSMENPEPRYLVEFFPLLSILGGIAIAQLGARTSLSAKRPQHAR